MVRYFWVPLNIKINLLLQIKYGIYTYIFMRNIKKIKSFFISAPLVLTKEVKKIDTKGLEKKTKAELEKLGRKIGIELDKRLTKAKLISKLKKENKKL